MRGLLIASVLVSLSLVSFNYSQAACVEGPVDTFTCNNSAPNPDPTGVQQFGNNNNLTVNVLPGAAIDTSFAGGGNGGDAIELSDGADTVTVDNGTVIGEDDGIETRFLNDTVKVTDSTIIGSTTPGDAIETSRGDDYIEVVNSTLTGADDGITSAQDNDTVKIHNSTVTGNDDGVELQAGNDNLMVTSSTITSINSNGITCAQGNDIVMIEDSTVNGFSDSINGGSGNDVITFKTGANMTNLIRCGSDFDTLVFAMEVPEDLVLFISSQINAANPAGDSLEINGLTYTWEDCELLVSEVVGVPIVPRPVPTLSEWGLIAMAGAMGLFGIFFVVRRQRAAV